MADIISSGAGGLTAALGGMGNGLLWMVVIGIALLMILIIGGAIAFFFWNKKRWNLKVEFKMVRADGKFVGAEWGKGCYTRNGRVMLKRKGVKKYYMKPFDLKQYLQGGSILTVNQLGVSDWMPVHPNSFKTFKNSKGQEFSIANMEGESEKDKAWKTYNEREMKSAFSIRNMMDKIIPFLGFGLLILMNFIGFAVLYGRIKPG